MKLIPIQKAFDTSNRSSSYIFLCPYRSFPIIISYQSLSLLADINSVSSVVSLLDMYDFDDFECGVSEDNPISELIRRGYAVSAISLRTNIQPLEIAMYYSGIVSPDDITLRIILERTNNLDIQVTPLQYAYGELVSVF